MFRAEDTRQGYGTGMAGRNRVTGIGEYLDRELGLGGLLLLTLERIEMALNHS
jgi:hypothetical protein